MGCVYLITNNVNRHQYVGKTTRTADIRWGAHVREARKLDDRPICRAIRKYGEESFTIEVLEESDDDDFLCLAESIYIEELGTRAPNGYNLTDGGDGLAGRLHTEEEKRRVSDKLKGNKYGVGYHHTEEARQAISKAHTGNQYAAILNEDDVRTIRAKYAEGHLSYGDLAKQYGVSSSTIAKIVQRVNWRDVV